MNAQGADDQQVAAALRAAVMHLFVHDRAVCRAVVLRPLVFYMNERPLPPAKRKMLQSGKKKVFLLRVDYPSTVQVTPSGRASLLIVMV